MFAFHKINLMKNTKLEPLHDCTQQGVAFGYLSCISSAVGLIKPSEIKHYS